MAELFNKRDYANKRKRHGYPEAFERFWQACPRRVEKLATFKAWQKALRIADISNNRLDEPVEYFLERTMKAYAATVDEIKYAKHPTTWLNAGCWDDELPEPAPELPGWEVAWSRIVGGLSVWCPYNKGAALEAVDLVGPTLMQFVKLLGGFPALSQASGENFAFLRGEFRKAYENQAKAITSQRIGGKPNLRIGGQDD